VVVVVHTLPLLMLVCTLFSFTVSIATNCRHGLFMMNMKAFRIASAPTLLLLSHTLSDQLYFICCQRNDLAVLFF